MLCVGLRRIQTRGIASTHTHRRHVEVLVDDVRWAALADAAEDERHDDGEREDDECRLHTCPPRPARHNTKRQQCQGYFNLVVLYKISRFVQ